MHVDTPLDRFVKKVKCREGELEYRVPWVVPRTYFLVHHSSQDFPLDMCEVGAGCVGSPAGF